MKGIAIVGYPRSGNTWAARTLGDILESPVGGAYGAKPLCTEGQMRPGSYTIMQLHWKPTYRRGVAKPAWELSVPEYDGSPKLVLVVRDPRDVAVSTMNYWNMQDIDRALDSIVTGVQPCGVHGPWDRWNKDWLDCSLPYIMVSYEDMHADPGATWHNILEGLGQLFEANGEKFRYDAKRIDGAISRQEFNAKRAQIAVDGDGRPYGKTIQLKHLHRGEVGSWKHYMNATQCKKARHHLGKVARRLGYEL